jgi:nucleotide-binding universal stress UspA family protein
MHGEEAEMAERNWILVPTDFDEGSQRALAEARRLAAELGAELCLVHVKPRLPEPQHGALPGMRAQVAVLDAARNALDDLAAEGDRVMLREGDADDEILAVIDEVLPTLVVMATHARRGVERLVVGSVTESVVRRSPAPVVILSPVERETGQGLPGPSPSRGVILVPIDRDPSPDPAIETAARLARALRCDLCLLHVNPVMTEDIAIGTDVDDAARADLVDDQRFLEERARAAVGARTLLRQGDPVGEILAVIDELSPRLVVMGTRGRRGFARAVLGSAAERVARNSSSPVVTVRGRTSPEREMDASTRIFTAVTRAGGERATKELGLLHASVTAAEPSAPGEYVGESEGVILDEGGAIIAFVVRLSPRLVPREPARTLIPTAALEVRGSVLHVRWTEDQLLAQPRLDADFQEHNRVDGGPPVESQWMPARPNVIPPGSGFNTELAAREAAAGGAIGAAVGTAVGLVAGGPIAALSLGLFFAAGGSLAGVISGASQETAAEAGELHLDDDDDGDAPKDPRLAALARRLRDPAVRDAMQLRSVRFVPLTSTREAA